MTMDGKRMVKLVTNWKTLREKGEGEPTKRWMNDLLDGIKIIRITNRIMHTRN